MTIYIKIILAVAGLVIIWLIWTFNKMVIKRNRVDESWADIDVQLRRRYNLIPNLVETVKAYARHESILFTKVTEARAQAIAAKTMPEHNAAEKNLTSLINGLFAVAENYPDLKASANFSQLQTELTDTEDKIQAARRFYNSNVLDYNNTLRVFPNNLIAKSFGFGEKEFFKIENSAEKETPKVSF